MDCLAIDVFNRPHKIACGDIESIDRTAVCVVGHQERIAEWAKAARCHRETPGLVQWRALHQTPHVGSIFVKDVNKTTRSSGNARKCDIEEAVYVPNTERRETRRKGCVGK